MSAPARPRPNTFADLRLERAAERRDDSAWLAELERAADTRYVLLDVEGRVWVDGDDNQPYWLDAAARTRLFGDRPASLLGLHGPAAYFALLVDAEHVSTLNGGGAQPLGLRAIASRFDVFHTGLAAYASALAQWQATTRFCCVCSAPLRLVSAGHRAQCTAGGCGRLHFPRTDAAVIMTVEHEGACLLGRQANWRPGHYSTLAGFVEPGEALEDAVRREVWEETGVEVIDCDYHSSQPWPFPASLMVGFHARARGRAIELRDGELDDARWFTPDEIVAGVGDGSLAMASALSVSRRLIDDWMQRRAGVDRAELLPAP